MLVALVTVVLIATLVGFDETSQASLPVTPYTFVMHVSGSTYQVLNSDSSVIKSSNSSSEVFNYLLGSSGVATRWSSVFVEEGNYLVDSTWFIYVSDITVNFASQSTLTLANDVNSPVIYLINCYNCTINNVSIDGKAANQAIGDNNSPNPVNGILLQDCTRCVVNRAIITNARMFGVAIEGGSSNGVIDSILTNCGWNGIQLGSGGETGLYAVNNEISHSSDVGITSWGYNVEITGNYIHDMDGTTGFNSAHWGVALESGGGNGAGNYCFIAKNNIIDTDVGVIVSSSGNGNINYVIISGNRITNSRTYGIEIVNSNYNTIEFNTITNTGGEGISLDSTVHDTNVYGNTYSGCTNNFTNSGFGTPLLVISLIALYAIAQSNLLIDALELLLLRFLL
jgi:parallel beta-helix repeat protein